MKGRLLVQCDWEHTYRKKDGKFWITYKNPGQPSVHSHILCERDINDRLRLTAEHPSFEIDQHSAKQFTLSYNNGEGTLATSTFRAPSKEFNFHGKAKKVTCLDVSHGGLGLSCAESSSTIKIWESDSGKVRRELTGHAGDVYRAKFFPSGVVLLSGGADTQLKIWSAETGECAATMTGHKAGVLDFDFVDKGRNVVSCSRDGRAKLWDVSKQRCIHSYPTDDGVGIINACALRQTSAITLDEDITTSGDGSREVETEGKLLLLALEAGKLIGFGLTLKKQVCEVTSPDSSAINCVSFLSGNSIVVGTDGGMVAVYDLRNLSAYVKEWSGCGAILSIKEYKQGLLYSSGDGSAVYIDEVLSPCYEMTGADCDPVYQVCHDGSRIYTSCRDGMTRVYS